LRRPVALSMISPTSAFFLAIVLFAGLVHGMLGLGFPLVATPMLALVLDVREAIVLTLLPTAALNVASILRGGSWRATLRRFWPLAAWAFVGSALGSRLLVVSDPRPFDLVLAGLIVLYLVASRLESFSLAWPRSSPQLAMLVFGLLGGLSAGTTNVMVPILIIYTLEMRLERTAMVQVFNLTFLGAKLAQIGVFGAAGAFTVDVLSLSVPLALAALVALGVGMRIHDRIRAETYRSAIRIVLAALAVALVGRYLAG
jgi:uncharacterized membrane protein YfcA